MSPSKEIQEVLEEYKEKIDAQKAHPLDISSYKVTKPWGWEQWIELNEFYAYKVIHMIAGNKSSLQSHDQKIETNYVISGTAEVLLENESGEMESRIYNAGEGWCVPLKRKHRVIAITDYTALECSTPHLNDVIRYNDEYDRPDGKIESEHS